MFISVFCFLYKVDLSEAARTRPAQYTSFNDFFTRTLAPGARPIQGKLSSPADGFIAAFGDLEQGQLIQAKGIRYGLDKLMAEADVEEFSGGSFITIYLAPHNYHRVHTPCAGELQQAKYLPGKLFSVNQVTAAHVPDLFANNERLVCKFKTQSGVMGYVMVGAMLVAGIKPVWLAEQYLPQHKVETEMNQSFAQGDELGQFQMGSTVILIFDHRVNFLVEEGQAIRVGEALC